MSLGNGVDRVLLLRKIPMQLRGTNFCTSSACFAPSFVRQPNGSKCNQMVQNSAKHEFRVNGVDRVRLLRKIPMRLRGTNFYTSSARFELNFVRQPNGPECTRMVRNTPIRPFSNEFRKATKRSQMHPNGTKLSKT